MQLAVSKELYNVMDALAALKLQLECEPDIPGDVLVVSASSSSGGRSTSARVRTAVRSRPMLAEACRPWPTTSPTTRATRALDSAMTSIKKLVGMLGGEPRH